MNGFLLLGRVEVGPSHSCEGGCTEFVSFVPINCSKDYVSGTVLVLGLRKTKRTQESIGHAPPHACVALWVFHSVRVLGVLQLRNPN